MSAERAVKIDAARGLARRQEERRTFDLAIMHTSTTLAVAALLGGALPPAQPLSSQLGPVPIDDLCAALVSFANKGCSEATPKPDEETCISQLAEYDATGDGKLGTDESEAATDAVSSLAMALEAVDVEAGCVREQVIRIFEEVQGLTTFELPSAHQRIRTRPPQLFTALIKAWITAVQDLQRRGARARSAGS